MWQIASLASILLAGAFAVAAEEAAGPTTQPAIGTQMLKYHDGKAEGKKSYGGSGEMIEFSMPDGFTKLAGVSIFGSRYGMPQPPQEDFTIYVMDETHSTVLHTETAPYRLFARGPERWVTVRFPKPLELTGTFWIALNFNAHQTKGVYVSYDTSTAGEHSLAGLPEKNAEPVDFGGDWMIQVTVAR